MVGHTVPHFWRRVSSLRYGELFLVRLNARKTGARSHLSDPPNRTLQPSQQPTQPTQPGARSQEPTQPTQPTPPAPPPLSAGCSTAVPLHLETLEYAQSPSYTSVARLSCPPSVVRPVLLCPSFGGVFLPCVVQRHPCWIHKKRAAHAGQRYVGPHNQKTQASPRSLAQVSHRSRNNKKHK